jgi:DNA-binding CsgD family transcriptional regulator/tetratricopeptide (TPR) repeat protein
VSATQETGAGRARAGLTRWQPVLLERNGELAAVDALIGGMGSLLAIEGPPGIGKTALLAEARRRGEAAGLQVLGARGSEFERRFSFGIVRQLFEPLLVQLSEEERADVVTGAAGLAIPLFEPNQLAEGQPPDVSLGMLHGLYWLVANVAARQPLLLVVDDLHWCDLASLRWLAYILPRIEGLEVAVVAGARQGEPGEAPAVRAQILSDPLTTIVRPAPLSTGAVTELIREALSTDADEAFCAACHEITGGSPLLLHELVNALVTEGVVPVDDSVPGLRELAARAGWRAVSVRLGSLPQAATRLAQSVAVLGDDVDPHQAAEMAELSDEEASAAAADLARADVLRPNVPLEFVHPLIRGAVYETLTALERSSLHRRAAHLLINRGIDPERVAAHLLLAPPAPFSGEGSAKGIAVLREAARSARSRGASESAAAYLRRAYAEPVPGPQRADVLLELGMAEALVSGNAAVDHLRRAHELLEDPIRRAKTALMLGRQLFFLRPDESVAVLTQALDELAGVEPELERVLEAGLITNALFWPEIYEEARRRLERIRAQPSNGSISEKMLLALLAFHDARANMPAADAVALARRALTDDALLPGEVSSGPYILASIVLASADDDDAVAMFDAAVADAHRRGSILAFGAAKAHRAETFLFRGDLREAEAEARDAFVACDTWGMSAAFPGLLASFLGEALMEQGRLDEAAAVLSRGEAGQTSEMLRADVFLDRRARLHLLRGELALGLQQMLAAGRRFEAVAGRNPAFMPWRSQAALALLQLERLEEAAALAQEELELARVWGAPRALGAALRVAGLVEGGKGGLALLQEAVEVLTGSPAKLEQAKARTELGAALRRANQRNKAREQLRRAVELATICGATPLAARAESELLATGARPRRVALSGVESLTPSELRVAELAAEGPTNREIAQTLFITAKTVEVHLSSVYRKLGISSRSQLAGALGEPARAD